MKRNKSQLYKETTWVINPVCHWSTCKCNNMQTWFPCFFSVDLHAYSVYIVVGSFWVVFSVNIYMLPYSHIVELRLVWLLKRDLATILPMKSKLSGKFQHFTAIDGSIKALKSSWISKNFKLKILKHFMSPKQQSNWRELFTPLAPPDESFLHLWNKNFWTAIYDLRRTDICFPNAWIKQFWGF